MAPHLQVVSIRGLRLECLEQSGMRGQSQVTSSRCASAVSRYFSTRVHGERSVDTLKKWGDDIGGMKWRVLTTHPAPYYRMGKNGGGNNYRCR